MNRFVINLLAVATAPLPRRGGSWSSLLGLLALACTAGSDSDQGGTNDGTRAWASESSWLEVRLEAVSNESLDLGEVIGLDIGYQDAIYVQDGLRPDVLVLDSLLSPVATIGQRGEGPGEFMFVRTVQVLPGDSLMVFDAQLKRITVFADPQYDSMRSTVVSSEVSQLWRMLGTAQNYLAYAQRSFYAGESSEADDERNDVFFVLGEDGQSKQHDSVLVAPSPETLVARQSGAVSLGPHPYGRRGFVAMLASGGFTYVNSDSLSVAVFDDRGRRIRSFAYPTTPLPVSSEALGAELEKLRPHFAEVLRDGAPYTRPPLVGMVADDQDRIWLGLRGTTEDALWEWAAFESDGSHVGSVRLPPGLVLHAARKGKLLGVALDDLDVPRIHLYRILGTTAR